MGGWVGGLVGGWDISGVGSHMRKLIESLSGNSKINIKRPPSLKAISSFSCSFLSWYDLKTVSNC